MRKVLLLLFSLAACAKSDAPATDSAAAPAAPAAPAKLSAADIAGSWTGTSMAEKSDSVTNHWTSIYVNDSTGKLISDNATDTVHYAVVYDADSMIATSKPYTAKTSPKTPVVFRSVGRLKDGKLVGTTMTTLASKPDSVLARGRWTASKKP